MPRDFYVNGESLVRVRGGNHSKILGAVQELGLTSDGVRITPVFKHRDINIDDFGPDTPAEVMYQLAEVHVDMTLIHFDEDILDGCFAEALAGGGSAPDEFGNIDVGVLAPCGSMMGNLKPLFASGNHFISLNILSESRGLPWRFPASYLTGPAVEFPLGTRASAVGLRWRVIPYGVPTNIALLTGGGGAGVATPGEIISSGVVLWDRTIQGND